MANEQNLKPIKSKEKARELGSRGGKQKGINYAKKRAMKEKLIALLSLPSDIREKVDKETSGLIAMVEKWELTGDKGLGEFIRDTIGEKPEDKVINITPPTIIDDI